MKALGADIKEFWLNHWPDGMYVEDNEEALMNDTTGEPQLEDGEKYDLNRFGYLLRNQGSTGQEASFETYFRRWIKERDTVTVIVTVPRGKEDECIGLIKQAGWKAVKA